MSRIPEHTRVPYVASSVKNVLFHVGGPATGLRVPADWELVLSVASLQAHRITSILKDEVTS